ncbi:hypothetical protein ACFS6H_20120 [Terrimonas rubra]|uniref:Uncharacterized protein n=1 Tax=Terrimonas rubra TaxID=1035890 RepID=A0ABW6ACY3_9BACT
MKNALFVLLVMLANYSYSQVYNPAQHTLTPKSMGFSQAVSTDARSTFYDPTTFSQRPFNSKEEVMATLNTPAKRIGGFDIFIKENGETKVYWFKDGTNLENLVLKSELDDKAPRVTNKGNGTTTTIISDSVRVKLGGELSDSLTHIYLPVGRKTNQNTLAQSKSFVITNRPYTGTAGTDWGYWNERGNNSLLTLERMFDEATNDTADQQYNGILKAFSRLRLDRNSTRFKYNNQPIKMQNMGISSAVQLYPPQDSTHLIPGPFGYDGAAGRFSIAFGESYGYNLAIKPTITDFPQNAVFSEIDFNRVIDNTYRKKMTGPITNYLAGWKAHQSNISLATPDAGSRYEQVSDYTSFGTWYPLIGSSVTKEKVLSVSRVDIARGFFSLPKRLPTNEVVNGYPFQQIGTEDISHTQGYWRFGFNAPTWGEDGMTIPQLRKVQFDNSVAFNDTTTFNNEKLKFIYQNLGPTSNWNWIDSPDSTYRLIMGSRTGHSGTMQIYGSGSVATDNRGGFDFTAVDRAGITNQTNKVKHRFYIRDNSPGGTGAYVNYFQIAKDSTSMYIQANVNDTIAFTPLLINKTTGSLSKTPWNTISNMIGYTPIVKGFIDSLSGGLITDSTYQKLITGATGNYDSVYTYIKAYPATTWDSVFSFRVPKYNPGGTGITALTGDVTASGTGSVAATISNDAITSVKLASNSVTNAKIADNSISSGKLQSNSVSTSALIDGNVTNAKISDVSSSKITGGSEGQVVKYFLGTKTWAYEDFDMAAALSDETTTLTTGTKLTFYTQSQLLIRDVRASLTTASSSGLVTISITVNGNPMFSTPLTIDAGEESSFTAATPFVFDGGSSTFGSDNNYKVVVTVSGAGTGAAGLKLYMKGYKMSQ